MRERKSNHAIICFILEFSRFYNTLFYLKPRGWFSNLVSPQENNKDWNFTVFIIMVLARFVGAVRSQSFLLSVKNICSNRSFLWTSDIKKLALSDHCSKRSTATAPLDQWTDISLTELKAMLTAGNIQLFDVREPHELVQTGKIACATNIPLRKVPEAFTMDPDEFEEEFSVKQPQKNDINIVFHCFAGVRSRAAMEAVHQIGFTKARQYPGGYEEWARLVEHSERSEA